MRREPMREKVAAFVLWLFVCLFWGGVVFSIIYLSLRHVI